MKSGQRKRLSVAWFDHSAAPGGGQLGLKRYLQSPARRHDASVYLLEDGWLSTESRRIGIPTTVVAQDGPIRAMRRLARTAARSEHDLIVLNSRRATNLAAASRTPSPQYIAYLREDLHITGLHGVKRAATIAAILPRMDGLLSNSQWTDGTIPRGLRRLPRAIARPVCGIDALLADNVRPSLLEHENIRLLSLSRLEEWKGIHVILEALVRMDKVEREKVHLTIAGEAHFSNDRYAQSLHRTVDKHELPVSFVGHVDDTDQLLHSHDVLIHSSVRPEPFGQVIPQSMAAGLLTIASDWGGPSEILVHGQTGLLVKPNDASALVDALELIAKDPELKMKIAERGRNEARLYSDENAVRGLDDALSDLAEALGA